MKMFQAALGFLGHDPFPDGGVLVFDMYTSTASVSISYLDKVDFVYTTRLKTQRSARDIDRQTLFGKQGDISMIII